MAGFEQFNPSTRQPVDPSTSQKSVTRKATFQLDETVVKQLDRFHLQLQLDLGKSDAPYKEVIVEEAIARLLEEADENLSGATGGITPKATEADRTYALTGRQSCELSLSSCTRFSRFDSQRCKTHHNEYNCEMEQPT